MDQYDSPESQWNPPPPPPPPRKERIGRGCGFYLGWFFAIVFFLSSAVLVLLVIGLIYERFGEGPSEGKLTKRYVEKVVGGEGKEKILLMTLRGIISSTASDGMFGKSASMVEVVKQQLAQARLDDIRRS